MQTMLRALAKDVDRALPKLTCSRASMRSGLNVNGAGSEAMKMQRQDVVLAPARAIQMPAAAVVWRLRNVDVFA